jgi:phosphoglucomutase
MHKNPIAVKTIVSTKLADKMGEHYGVQVINVLTGFNISGNRSLLWRKKAKRTVSSSVSRKAMLSGGHACARQGRGGGLDADCGDGLLFKHKGMSLWMPQFVV